MKQKVLNFCLRHWREIGLVLLLLVVFCKAQYDMHNIIEAHEISEQSLREQMDNLKDLHKQELQKREEALQQYQNEISELERKYEKKIKEVDNLTKKEKENIVKEFKHDKQEIIKRFQETYGLKYVE